MSLLNRGPQWQTVSIRQETYELHWQILLHIYEAKNENTIKKQLKNTKRFRTHGASSESTNTNEFSQIQVVYYWL